MAHTAEEIFGQWSDRATKELGVQERSVPPLLRTRRKVGSLQTQAKKDVAAFDPDCGVGPVQVAALGLLHEKLLAAKPVRGQKKPTATPLDPPKELLDRAEHRVMANRSVAATKLGEASDLAIALGFRTPVEKTATALEEALKSQKRVMLQKGADGHDLPNATANRALLKGVGLTPGFLTRKLDPILAELAPYLNLRLPTQALETNTHLCWTAVVAARDFFEAAELSFQTARHVKKYRDRQPRSQAGRFAKKKEKKAGTPRTRKKKDAPPPPPPPPGTGSDPQP